MDQKQSMKNCNRNEKSMKEQTKNQMENRNHQNMQNSKSHRTANQTQNVNAQGEEPTVKNSVTNSKTQR